MHRHDLTRRAFVGGLAAGALLLRPPRVFAAPPRGGADACVLVWLAGGASQLETFDPKPGTTTGGPTRAIETAVRGLSFAEPFEGLAARAKRLAVVRSLSHREGDHQRASHLVHTGHAPSTTVAHPTLGSIVAAERPAGGAVPSFVSLGPEPVGPGWLGVEHAAYVVRASGDRGSLLGRRAALDAGRLARRRSLLAALEAPFTCAAGLSSARTAATDRALAMLDGPLGGALDLEREDAATRERYGREPAGERLLGARRLVEAGVRLVEVVVDGWDDHEDIFGRLPPRARTLDLGLSALLDDLERADRRSRTLVVVMGEFGRTPTINERGGRDHEPRLGAALLAGGGVPGGVVVGATSPDGREVTARPVSVADLAATVLDRLGIDPAAERWAGERPVKLVDGGAPIPELTN